MLTRAVTGVDGPTIPSLIQTRGDRPVQPGVTAPPILPEVMLEYSRLSSSIIDTAFVKDTINNTVESIRTMEEAKKRSYDSMYGPDGFIAKH
jgi:hypothetical protein